LGAAFFSIECCPNIELRAAIAGPVNTVSPRMVSAMSVFTFWSNSSRAFDAHKTDRLASAGGNARTCEPWQRLILAYIRPIARATCNVTLHCPSQTDAPVSQQSAKRMPRVKWHVDICCYGSWNFAWELSSKHYNSYTEGEQF